MVEDDHATLSLLAAIAKREGFEALLAGDGAKALAIVTQHPVDAMVLDLLLPELSGFDILRFCKRKMPALLERTIVITAASEQAYQDCEELLHVRRFYRKPLDFVDLTSALHACRAAKARDAGEGLSLPAVARALKHDAG
jgi:DNA-binding response OmpR family regulator